MSYREQEKAILYDTLVSLAQWKKIGTASGYWEIHVWCGNGEGFEESLTREHNKLNGPKEGT